MNVQQQNQIMAPPTHLALYRRIATVFLVLTMGTIGLVLYVVLSRATVVILSRQEEVKLDTVIDIARQPIEGEISGEVIELSDELTQSFPSTSVVKVDVPATGRVVIKSTLSRAQTLVATTRLATADGVLFRIRKTVLVPANGSVEVDVYADQVGPGGDIGAATFTIPGLLPENRKYFTVETVTPLGGGVKDVRMVTKGDVAGAAEVVRDKLSREMTAKLITKAREGGAAVSGAILATEVLNQMTDESIGSEASEFDLTLRLKVTGVFYDEAQFQKQIAARLKELVPFDRKFQRVEEQATVVTVEKTDPASGRANLRVAAKGLSIMSPDAPALDPAKLSGVTVEAARSYLEKIDGVASASVKVSPFWSGRLPNIAEHIKVEVR